MKDLLEFLNKASLDELKKIAGIETGLAEKIQASRPYVSLEDCVRFNEISAETLAQINEQFEQHDVKTSNTEPVAEIDAISRSSNAAPEVNIGSNKTSRILLRVLLALMILAGIAAAVYFGVPYFYEKILRPLESNTSRLSEMATQQSSDVTRLDKEIITLQERIAALELQSGTMDQTLAAHSKTLTQLAETQSAIKEDIASDKSELLARMDKQLTLTRALELLSRGRLYLSQSNFGLAKMDISASRDLLFGLLSVISADQEDGLKIVINRLDLALTNLPVYPVIAVYDVDTAWQLLVDGLPNVPETAVIPSVIASEQPSEITPTPETTPGLVDTPTP